MAPSRTPLRAMLACSSLGMLFVAAPGEAVSPPPPAYFVDPTARLVNAENIHLGELVYVAPFAVLRAGIDSEHGIRIGAKSDVQDNTLLDAGDGAISIGEEAIVAHGAKVVGPASIGVGGDCPDTDARCASFVSFNARVEGAVIEMDAVVSALSRVGPGVTIPSGRKTVAGADIRTQEEVEAKTTAVTETDRDFMSGVLHVNETFELTYTDLAAERPSNVRGINYDPGGADFNPDRDLPVLAGTETRDPSFPNRVIGDISLVDTKSRLARVMGRRVSLRADEGEPFAVGSILCLANRTTFHALEHTHLDLGDDACYGFRSIVHGGPTDAGDATVTGDGFTLGAFSVFYKSVAGNDVTIGYKSVVQGSELPAGTVVPARTIMVDNEIVGTVEW